MLKAAAFFLVFCTVLKSCSSFQPPWMFMGRPVSGFRQMNQNIHINLTKSNSSQAEWFEQNLDHFNKSDNSLWKQQFWHNKKYATPNGPQFLILGGEAPASVFDVTYEDYPHVQYAKTLGAGLWTLEHRFYGDSQPFNSLATENLKYLSSRQALADIANFIDSQNKILNLSNPKWILFGGSYAGTLALWFRELYPHLSIGAVASSAPVRPKYEFSDHFLHVENVIKAYSKNCSNDIKTSFENFNAYMSPDKFEEVTLSFTFQFNPLLQTLNFTNDTIGFVYSNVMSYYQVVAQYNNVNVYPFSNKISLESLCEMSQTLNFGKIDDKDIAYVIQTMLKLLRGSFTGVYIDYSQLISYLKNIGYAADSDQASTRAWTWQACSEFGYFPATSDKQQFLTNNVSIDFYIKLCKDVFGPNFNVVNKTIDSPVSSYNGTNIVASRGSDDPWSLLALTDPPNPTFITYQINNTGHCTDMAPVSDSDSDSLRNYRNIVVQNIEKWIS